MKRLLFTFLSLFIVAQFALAQSSAYSNVANGESAKPNKTETSLSDSRKLNDSLKQIALTAEIDALRKQLIAQSEANQAQIDQLKARSESNQSQIDQLKVDNARTKIAGTVNRPVDNTLMIAQLKAQSDTNQALIHQLKQELAKSKEAEMEAEDSRKLKDSLLRHFLIAETDALLTQLKAKTDTNQIQFERLKVELEKGKTTERSPSSIKENDEVIAQLKAKSDTYQVQLDQLKAELAKSKEAERAWDDSRKSKDSLTLVNSQGADVKLALLKAKSESNQAQIDQLKVDNARAKISGTLTSPNTDNTLMIGQLKVKSDSSQAQIDRLKTELAKVKNLEVKTPSNNEYGELIAQLKTQSDNNQAQIDMLVETITKTREEMAKSADSKKTVAVDKEVLGVQLIEKSNSGEAIVKLDPEKTNKSVPNQPIPAASEAGVPSYKTDRFVDEKGGAAGNGYYVVIGTFGSKENAERFKAASIIKGHRNTKIIQNKITKMYNIFALKTNSKKDADLERAKYKGEYSNVWILKLE